MVNPRSEFKEPDYKYTYTDQFGNRHYTYTDPDGHVHDAWTETRTGINPVTGQPYPTGTQYDEWRNDQGELVRIYNTPGDGRGWIEEEPDPNEPKGSTSQGQKAPEPTADRVNDDIPANLDDFAKELWLKNFMSQDAQKAEDSPIRERDLTTWEQVKSQDAHKVEDSPIAEEAAGAALRGIDPDSVLSSGYLGPTIPDRVTEPPTEPSPSREPPVLPGEETPEDSKAAEGPAVPEEMVPYQDYIPFIPMVQDPTSGEWRNMTPEEIEKTQSADPGSPQELSNLFDAAAPGPTLDPALFDPSAPGPTLDAALLDPASPGPTLDPNLLDPSAPGETIDPALLDPASPGPTLDLAQIEHGIVKPGFEVAETAGLTEQPNFAEEPSPTTPGQDQLDDTL